MSHNRVAYLATVVNLAGWAIDLPTITDAERGLLRGLRQAASMDQIRPWGEQNMSRKEEVRRLFFKMKALLDA